MPSVRFITTISVLCLNALGANEPNDPSPNLPPPAAGGAVILSGTPDASEIQTIGELVAGVSPDKTLFEIGSVTKVFTGLLLGQAVVDGKLHLDTTLAEAWPALSSQDPNVAAIAMLELATHCSGLPRLPDNLADGINQEDPYAQYDEARLKAFLESHQRRSPDNGDQFLSDYSNLGMGLLGLLVAKQYERSYEEHLQATILQPLGMENTAIDLSPPQVQRLTTPYDGSRKVQNWQFQALAGAGAIRSTAADLATFAKAFLQPDKTPLAEAINLVIQPRADTAGGSIGLGIFIESIYDKKRLYHDGGTGGYTASWMLTPDENTFQVILANQANAFASQIAANLIQPAQPPTIEDSQPQQQTPTRPWAAYVGQFRLSPQAVFTIREIEGTLYLRLTGQLALPTDYIGNNTFQNAAVGATIQFSGFDESPNSKATQLTLNQAGRQMAAPRINDTAPPALLLPQGAAAQYAGDYQLAPGQIISVSTNSRQLIVQLTGQPAIPVIPLSEHEFVYDVVDARIQFQPDASGNIQSLTLFQNGMELKAPRIQDPNTSQTSP